MGVIVRIWHRAAVGEPGRFVTDEAHAVGEKMQVVVLPGAAHQRLRRRIDIATHSAGLDRLEGGLLNLLDFGEQLAEFGVGLAKYRHAGDVADIAVVIAAGIQRQDVTLLPFLLGRRAIVTRACGDQTIFEGEAAVGLLPAQCLRQFEFAGSGAVICDHRQHGIDDAIRRDTQLFELIGAFVSALPLQHDKCVGDFDVREGATQRRTGIKRQKRHLDTDAARPKTELADMVDRLLHGIDRARRSGLRGRNPEWLDLPLITFQPMAEIGGLVHGALDVDENRQIAADPHGIHVVEEKGAVAAEQVLDVVFGRRDKHVQAGLIHEAIEPVGIKRDVGSEIRRLGLREHVRCSLGLIVITGACLRLVGAGPRIHHGR